MTRIFIEPYLGKTCIGEKERKNLLKVINSKNLFRYQSKGSVSSIVEQKLSSLLDTENFLLLVNATVALKSSLLAFRPQPGGIVLIPALSYIATANACLSAGLVPVCLDVDDTGHLCPNELNNFLYSNKYIPEAVIVVHLDGSGANIQEIKSICDNFNIPIIEDTAQALYAKRNGKYLGTYGDVGCFSFQENKLLSTGEGGAVTAINNDIFEKICAYCDHGALRNTGIFQSWEKELGFGENYKANEMQASVLDAQLDNLGNIVKDLNLNYESLMDLDLPFISRNKEDVPISIWTENNEFKKNLQAIGIPYYNWEYLYLPDHPIIKNKLSVYSNGFPWVLNNTDWKLSTINAKRISIQRISIPLYLSDNQKFKTSLLSIRKNYAL